MPDPREDWIGLREWMFVDEEYPQKAGWGLGSLSPTSLDRMVTGLGLLRENKGLGARGPHSHGQHAKQVDSG